MDAVCPVYVTAYAAMICPHATYIIKSLADNIILLFKDLDYFNNAHYTMHCIVAT